MELWGLLSWIAAGFTVGLVFRLVTRVRLSGVGIDRGLWVCALLGAGGSLLGGMAATVLGFGGLAAYDPRSLTLAALAGLLVVLADRWLGTFSQARESA